MSLPPRPQPPRVRLQVEALEDRCVPAVVTGNYVTAVYADLLHRLPQPTEVSAWLSVLGQGVTPEEMTLSVTQSVEFRNNLVRFDYLVLLNRPPFPQETAAWVGLLQDGLSEQQLEANILASDEFFALHSSSPQSWLFAVYQAVLGRAPDAAGLTALNQGLTSFFNRLPAAFNVVHSPLAHAGAVTDDYQQLLQRDPDVPAAQGWVRQLDLGVEPSTVAAEIAASPEFILLAEAGHHNTVGGIPPGTPLVISPLIGFNPALGTSLGGNSIFEAQTFFINPALVV